MGCYVNTFVGSAATFTTNCTTNSRNIHQKLRTNYESNTSKRVRKSSTFLTRLRSAVFEGIIDELRLIQQEGLQYYASVSATLSHWIEKSQTQSSSTITLKKSKKQLDQEKIVSNPIELISSYLYHLQEVYLSFEKEFFERKKILEVDYEQSADYATLMYQKFTAPYKYIDINMILAVVDTAERSVSNSKIEL